MQIDLLSRYIATQHESFIFRELQFDMKVKKKKKKPILLQYSILNNVQQLIFSIICDGSVINRVIELVNSCCFLQVWKRQTKIIYYVFWFMRCTKAIPTLYDSENAFFIILKGLV